MLAQQDKIEQEDGPCLWEFRDWLIFVSLPIESTQEIFIESMSK